MYEHEFVFKCSPSRLRSTPTFVVRYGGGSCGLRASGCGAFANHRKSEQLACHRAGGNITVIVYMLSQELDSHAWACPRPGNSRMRYSFAAIDLPFRLPHIALFFAWGWGGMGVLKCACGVHESVCLCVCLCLQLCTCLLLDVQDPQSKRRHRHKHTHNSQAHMLGVSVLSHL
jgi:hypothetical protein